MNFQIDERLANDTVELGDFSLCKVLLMNEVRYPWLILVPKVEGLRELMELSEQQMQLFCAESKLVQVFLKNVLNADKLNVAALGNMVPQLHIHHIARFTNDEAWPAPVWGKFPPQPYEKAQLSAITSSFEKFIGEQAQ